MMVIQLCYTPPVERSETIEKHEAIYDHLIADLIASTENGTIPKESLPHIVSGIRQELRQCLDLNLMSEEFVEGKMKILNRVSPWQLRVGDVIDGFGTKMVVSAIVRMKDVLPPTDGAMV